MKFQRLNRSARQKFEDAIEAFERSWQHGNPLSIEETLRRASLPADTTHAIEDFRLQLAHELALIDIEYRCGAGLVVSINDYLNLFPEMADDTEFRKSLRSTELLFTQDVHRRRELVAECGSTFQAAVLEVEHVQPQNDAVSGSLQPLQSGEKVGRYLLLEEAGRGSFGTVFRAYDPRLDRCVAIKAPRNIRGTDPAERQSFLDEARAVAKLSHAGIVPVFEAGVEDGRPYLVSEFVSGETLHQRLQEERFEINHTARLVKSLADALEYAHRQGIIHRDLKPTNIMWERIKPRIGEDSESAEGSIDRVRILDFGLADWEGRSPVVEGQLVGTPAFMSPEQANGDAYLGDHRMDIYSLGVLLYQMLAGTPPFHGTVDAVLKQIVQDYAPPPSHYADEVPAELDTICLKCIEKQPHRRYQTAGALADDLEAFLTGQAIAARPVSLIERWARKGKQYPLLSSSILAAVALLIAILGAMLNVATRAQEDARRQRLSKEEAQQRSVQQREINRGLYRRLYFAHLNLVQRAFEEHNTRRAHELLERYQAPMNAAEDPRGLEWYYWWNQIHGYTNEVLDGEPQIRQVAFSPDGTKYAICRDHPGLLVCKSETNEVESIIDLDHKGVSVAWSSDGKQIAVSTTSSVSVHDPKSLRKIWSRELSIDFASDIEFLPGDRFLAVQRIGSRAFVIFDLETDQVVFKFDQSTRIRPAMAISEQSGVLVFSDVNELQWFSLDRLSNSFNADELPNFDGEAPPPSRVIALEHNPVNDQFLALRESGTLEIWSAAKRSLLSRMQLKLAGQPESLALTPDGKSILVGNQSSSIELFEMESGKLLSEAIGHTDWVRSVDVWQDNRTMISGSKSGRLLRWDLKKLASNWQEPLSSEVHVGCVDLHHGRLIAVGEDFHSVDFANGSSNTWELPAPRYSSAAVSADGQRLALGTLGRGFEIYDIDENGQPSIAGRLQPDKKILLQSAFVKDRNWLAFSASGGLVRVVDVIDQRTIYQFDVDERVGPALALSPDGKWLAFAAADSRLRLVELVTGEVLTVRNLGSNSRPLMLKFNELSERLAISFADRSIEVWDVVDASPICRLSGHSEPATAIAFTNDESRLLTGAGDGTVKWWDLEESETLASFEMGSPIVLLHLSNSTDSLVAVTKAGQIRQWHIATGATSAKDENGSRK